MPTEPLPGGGGQGDKGALILEIGLKPGEVPVRLPVTVQNFAAGLLILKVTQTMNWVEWDGLPGHDSHLRLPRSGDGEGEGIVGKVSWIKPSGSTGASVFLGMEISQPADQVQQLLDDRVLHTPKDIKDMWQQWDRVQVQKRRSTVTMAVMLVLGVVLLVLGVVLLATPAGFLASFGYGSLVLGVVLALAGGVRLWQQRRV